MIQFNLLPSVKLEYVKARRNKRLTILGSGIVAAASLVILAILFFSVQIIQKKYSSDLSKDLKKQTATLQGVKDLNKILTIQNQLNSLTALHDSKPVTSRLFTYIKQITPAKVSIASFNMDFDAYTVNITGAADSISTINTFVDTLKFTAYSVTYKPEDQKKVCAFKELAYDQNTRVQICSAFSAVVLSGFGKDDKGASYTVSFNFDPAIFSSSGSPVLIVPPGKITSRSETEKPGEKQDDLFQPLSNTNGTKQ